MINESDSSTEIHEKKVQKRRSTDQLLDLIIDKVRSDKDDLPDLKK